MGVRMPISAGVGPRPYPGVGRCQPKPADAPQRSPRRWNRHGPILGSVQDVTECCHIGGPSIKSRIAGWEGHGSYEPATLCQYAPPSVVSQSTDMALLVMAKPVSEVTRSNASTLVRLRLVGTGVQDAPWLAVR